VCFNGGSWTDFRSYLGTGRMRVLELELWAIRVALQKFIARAKALGAHGFSTVAVFIESHVAIRRERTWTQG
jgi:hypothetical protein